MSIKPSAHGLVFPMQRGPFQNNGASPWYATLTLGTPGQRLKLSIDSGTNITWVTSTLCAPDQCDHFGGGRFDYQASSTFEFTDCLQRPYSFGPWGTMQVESASEVLTTPSGARLSIKLLLAAAYSGDQFKQLDWDGGIGLPCSSVYAEGRSSFVFQELLCNGQLDPKFPYVAFDWDTKARNGTCQMGAIDASKIHGPHLFLPWSVYSQLPGAEYLWSTDLKAYSVGGETLATDVKFALDSGSSRFKGDDRIMAQTLARIARGGHPEVVLDFADGQITLGADLYNLLIEEGPQKGQTLPQFAPLGLHDLVLTGSLVMEHCYTVHEYQVVRCGSEVYSLAPVGIWLFNRPDGPQIITRSSSRRFNAGQRPLPPKKVILNAPTAKGPISPSQSVAGTWENDYGSTMKLTVTDGRVSGTYRSSTGSTGLYEVTGYQLNTVALPALNQPVALAIEWHSISSGPADPSWNWCSGLSGQLGSTDKGDALTLSHLLVATSDFPGLADRATYVDKLVYRRVNTPQANEQHPVADIPVPLDNLLTGTWVAPDRTTLELSVHTGSRHRLGHVRGHLSAASELTRFEVSGFTDINAVASGLSLQSVALTAAKTSRTVSLCGSLDLDSETLKLVVLTSLQTTPAHAYLATGIVTMSFKRQNQSNTR